jgi:hypothetical protein
VVAGLLEFGLREYIIFYLCFLEAQDIGSMLDEPRNNAFEAFANGVDVPGGYLHSESGREVRIR